MNSPRNLFALLIAVSQAGCSIHADLCSLLDASTDASLPEATPMDMGADLHESGTSQLDVVDVVDVVDAADAADAVDAVDAVEAANPDVPRVGPPDLGSVELLGLGSSRGVSVVPGVQERGEYVVYYTIPGAADAPPHLGVRVQHNDYVACQSDWGVVSDGAHDVALDGHPANAGTELVVPVWNYGTGTQELWARDPAPPDVEMGAQCDLGTNPWVALPPPPAGVRIESGPTATSVVHGTGEARYIFAVGADSGGRDQIIAYRRVVGRPEGWTRWSSNIPSIPPDEEFISQPSAIQYLGGVSLVAFTRKRGGGSICMRGTWTEAATGTWVDGWYGTHGRDCNPDLLDDFPEPPITALASWGGYLENNWVEYYAFGAASGRIYWGRWRNGIGWDPWSAITAPGTVTVVATPTFLVPGGPPFAVNLNLIAVDPRTNLLQIAPSTQGIWPDTAALTTLHSPLL